MDQNAQILALLKKLGIGSGYAIPEDEDSSKQGAEFEILELATIQKLSEENPWVSQGYMPVGECLHGTGNWYYVQINTVQHALYRISDESEKPTLVLPNLSTIARYKGK